MAIYYKRINSTYEDVPTFGIALFIRNGNCSQLIKAVPDLSTDRMAVEKLVGLCNDLRLDPIHLDDVVEDFLTGM